MNTNKAIILIALLLAVSKSLGQQAQPPESESLRNFTEVKGRPEHMPSSFEFSTDRKYKIIANGRPAAVSNWCWLLRFQLRLHEGDMLQRNIYYAPHEGDSRADLRSF